MSTLKHLLAISLLTGGSHSYAGTIYLCKAYNDSAFWSSEHCSKKNALIDRIESVADVPFNQQVEQAEAGRRSATATAGQPSFSRDQYCGRLINERRQIEARYNNWQWQPPEVINPDQQRTIAINSALRANNCHVQ